jgi:hypothetical protein
MSDILEGGGHSGQGCSSARRDHWQPKAEGAHGPSDDRAEKGGLNRLQGAGGVDARASKAHLMDLAKQLDVKGRSRMTKPQLVEALMKANTRETSKARAR